MGSWVFRTISTICHYISNFQFPILQIIMTIKIIVVTKLHFRSIHLKDTQKSYPLRYTCRFFDHRSGRQSQSRFFFNRLFYPKLDRCRDTIFFRGMSSLGDHFWKKLKSQYRWPFKWRGPVWFVLTKSMKKSQNQRFRPLGVKIMDFCNEI